MGERLSKSEIKRRFKRVEEAAKVLADLSDKSIKKVPGSDFFHQEIKNCKGLKAGARKRQIKYLAKIMREEPMDEILDHLTKIKGSKIKEDQLHHEAERIRDTIINEAIKDKKECAKEHFAWEPDWESEEITNATNSLSTLDEDEVRKSVYQYVKSRNSIHYKELFRMIRSAIDYNVEG